MYMRPLISLCMIVKDEAAMIAGCLESVEGIADEIIIVDTGSVDETPEICRSFGASIINAPWQDSFSQARNIGIEQASGEWILCLDADEVLVLDDTCSPAAFRAIVQNSPSPLLDLSVLNYMGAGLDDLHGLSFYQMAQTRLFRNDSSIRFTRDVHETLVVPTLY